MNVPHCILICALPHKAWRAFGLPHSVARMPVCPLSGIFLFVSAFTPLTPLVSFGQAEAAAVGGKQEYHFRVVQLSLAHP